MKWLLILTTIVLLGACLKPTPKPDMFTTTPSAISPTVSVSMTPSPVPTSSDQELLDQLEKESDLNLDTQFKQLETELQ
jgi:hypothetical protein